MKPIRVIWGLVTLCVLFCLVQLVTAQSGADILALQKKQLSNKLFQDNTFKGLANLIPPSPEDNSFKIVVGVSDRFQAYANNYANNRSTEKRIHTGFDGIGFMRDEVARYSLDSTSIQPSPETVVFIDGQSHPALKFCPSGSIDPVPPQWGPVFTPNATKIQSAIQCTGAIITDQPQLPGVIATCFLIAPKVAITNRHVAKLFANDDLSLKASQIPGSTGKMKVSVTFSKYVCSSDQSSFNVAGVLYIEQDTNTDLALLQLDDPMNKLPAPMKLTKTQPTTLDQRKVFASGHPVADETGAVPQSVLDLIFGPALGVKRVSREN